MKRILAVTMSLLLLLVAVSACVAAEWTIGVKGGAAVQKLGGDDVPDGSDSRTGFVGGAYFQGDFSKNVGVRLETLYFMKGATANADTLGLSADATVQLNYVEFPLLAVAHVPVSETARIDLFGGPTFAFNTSAKGKVSVGGFSGSADIGDGITGLDIGLTFGGGINFDAGSAIVGIEGRYGFGFQSLVDSDSLVEFGFSEDADVKNQGFAILASIGMPLGKK